MIIDIQHCYFFFYYVVVKIGLLPLRLRLAAVHQRRGGGQGNAVASVGDGGGGRDGLLEQTEKRKYVSVVDQLARRFPFTYGLYNKIV